jgi:hypothetical protein
VRTCAEELSALTDLDGETVATWSLGDGGVIWRLPRSARTPTLPIVQLADAIVRLVTGALEEPPPGYWWGFGFGDSPELIQMKSDGGG